MRAPSAGARIAGFGLAWLLGIAVQLQEPTLSTAGFYAAIGGFAAVFLVLAIATRRRAPWLAALTGAAAISAAAFATSGWRATDRLADVLPSVLEGRDVVVDGVVASLPQRGANGVRFRFRVDEAARRRDTGVLPPLLAVGWYAGFHEDASTLAPGRELRAGQRWRLTLRLRRPHGNANPHGFDYELLLFGQGIGATGYVRDAPAPLRLADAGGYPVERLRQRLRDAIDAHVPDRRAAGVLAALAIGDQGAIDRDDWELFRNTGIAHLVSISGLHITMFAWLFGRIVDAAWRRSARAMRLLPAVSAGRWGGMAAAAAYAVVSGWGVPAQRTVWMLATVALLRSLGLRWPWPLVLLVAAVVVTLVDPWALTQAGFWLSFAAVGLLMVSTPVQPPVAAPRSTTRSPWRERLDRAFGHLGAGLRTQVVATIGLAPLTLVFFQQISLVGFAANLVAIPLVTLVVTPLALLGALAAPLWSLGALAVQGLAGYLSWLSSWPGAVWVVPAAPPWAQAAGLVAAVLLVLPLPWRMRAFAPLLALPLLVPPRELPPDGSFDLVAADVGQGSAILVRTNRHALLFDAGPQYSRDSDAGQRVLVPLLRALGDTRVDMLVLSHRDLDHVGGARAVLGSLDVAALSSSLESGHPVVALAGARASRCEAGQRWTWDGVEFAVLRPDGDDYRDAAARPAERPLQANAMSCVVRVSARAGGSAILTGDIERDQEAKLVAAIGEGLRSDVLLVPHHGSRTSSTAAFVDAVGPRIAVVQAGYRNRFGHPAADVMARYRERGIRVVDTVSCGAWTWRASGTAASNGGVCERERSRRYWRADALP